MEYSNSKPKKYPAARIRESQKKYHQLRNSLNKPGEFTKNAPEAFLFPLQNQLTKLYLIALVISIILCIVAFSNIP